MKCVECLFHPELIGQSCLSLTEAMFDAVSACEFEKRGQVMENLALTGGVCNLKGII